MQDDRWRRIRQHSYFPRTRRAKKACLQRDNEGQESNPSQKGKKAQDRPAHLLLAGSVQETVRAMPLLYLVGMMKPYKLCYAFPDCTRESCPYVHWTGGEAEEDCRPSEFQLPNGGQFPALSFESGTKAVPSNEDEAKDTRMWDMSYVNNAASAAADFDLRIFVRISFRRSWIRRRLVRWKRQRTPL